MSAAPVRQRHPVGEKVDGPPCPKCGQPGPRYQLRDKRSAGGVRISCWCVACWTASVEERRAKHRASGMCYRCGRSPTRPQRSTCRKCGRKESKRTAAWKQRKREAERDEGRRIALENMLVEVITRTRDGRSAEQIAEALDVSTRQVCRLREIARQEGRLDAHDHD